MEQATHFIDLGRYLLGEAEIATVQAVCIPGGTPEGVLLDVPKADDGTPLGQDVPELYRHPCATAAVWKFKSGLLGSLVHGTLLHGTRYETEIEIWGDGLRVVFSDPYGNPRLIVRRPGSEETEQIRPPDDDPYLAEDQVFIQAIRSGSAAEIRSTYADAMNTFRLSWAIADSANRTWGS